MNKKDLITVLNNAGSAHGDYEVNILDGIYDENWPAWYSAFIVGALGLDVIKPSRLVKLLENAHSAHQKQAKNSNWVDFYADYILKNI